MHRLRRALILLAAMPSLLHTQARISLGDPSVTP
jgi:hypothetical protein